MRFKSYGYVNPSVRVYKCRYRFKSGSGFSVARCTHIKHRFQLREMTTKRFSRSNLDNTGLQIFHLKNGHLTVAVPFQFELISAQVDEQNSKCARCHACGLAIDNFQYIEKEPDHF